jgi:hypothetical protein
MKNQYFSQNTPPPPPWIRPRVIHLHRAKNHIWYAFIALHDRTQQPTLSKYSANVTVMCCILKLHVHVILLKVGQHNFHPQKHRICQHVIPIYPEKCGIRWWLGPDLY